MNEYIVLDGIRYTLTSVDALPLPAPDADGIPVFVCEQMSEIIWHESECPSCAAIVNTWR